jgi:hypothetical protein
LARDRDDKERESRIANEVGRDKGMSHLQYISDKDGTGYSDTGGSREKHHWLERSSVGIEMDRVTNHRSMWGMVRASRLGDISERGLVGDSPVFLTSPRRLLNILTFQWLPLLVNTPLSVLVVANVATVGDRRLTGKALPSLLSTTPMGTW